MRNEDARQTSKPTVTAIPVPRLSSIDQLRALAALYVAVFHALLVIWPEGGPQPPWYLRWADYGHFGVTAFIVLSGLSLALKPAFKASETAGRYWPFMLKRGVRLLPAYWVALAGSVILLYLAPSNVANATPGVEWSKGPVPPHSIVVFGLLVQDFFKTPSPNSPMWSIAVEWHLYFLFPLLIFVGCRFGMKWMLAACAVVGITLHFVLWGTSAEATTPHFLLLFALGIATAYAVANYIRGQARTHYMTTLNGWLLIALSFVLFMLTSSAEVAADLLAGSVFALGVYVLAGREETETKGHQRSAELGHRLGLIGLFSYSIYLVHSPTEKIVWHFVVEPLHLNSSLAFVVLAVTAIAVSLVAAYVLYLLIERRSIQWSRRISTTR